MKRLVQTTALISLLPAGPALAHPGHLAGLGGHDHWVAGIALGVAAAISLSAAIKEFKKRGKPGRKPRKSKKKPKVQDA